MTSPELAGKALYLEMVVNPDLSEDEQRRVTSWLGTNSVKQVIIFPPHTDDTGRTHAVRVMSRQVSDRSPRAQWDWSNPTSKTYRGVAPKPIAPHAEVDSQDDYTLEYYSDEEWDTLPEIAKQEAYKLAITIYLKQQTLYRIREEDDSYKAVEGWVVRNGKPISVETTTQDLEEVEVHKTPQAVIRRINKVRDSIPEFPKKLV